jgi:chitinase
MRGGNTGAPEGPFLELAYWIGPTPGVADPNPALNAYRDRSYRGRGAVDDRFVVMHLHIDRHNEAGMLRNIGGRTYL